MAEELVLIHQILIGFEAVLEKLKCLCVKFCLCDSSTNSFREAVYSVSMKLSIVTMFGRTIPVDLIFSSDMTPIRISLEKR